MKLFYAAVIFLTVVLIIYVKYMPETFNTQYDQSLQIISDYDKKNNGAMWYADQAVGRALGPGMTAAMRRNPAWFR